MPSLYATKRASVKLWRGVRDYAASFKRWLSGNSPRRYADLCPPPKCGGGKVHAPCQVLMALVNVNRLPKGSATDMSLVPQGISSIPGRAYL